MNSNDNCIQYSSISLSWIQKFTEGEQCNCNMIHASFISNIFISNARLKFTENQSKAKQHLKAKLLLSENYSLCLLTLSSKNNRRHSKKRAKLNVSILIGLYDRL